ncbi:MAG: hypothetical protein P4L84_28575 [Isosphaeraceae bacterium]|nr:hypothetical protein [Isosphaeraceae bacterium]
MESRQALKRWTATAGAVLACSLSLAADDKDPSPPGEGQPPAARYAAAELRARIAATQRRITSIRVETHSSDYSDDAAQRAGTYVHRVIAAKAPASLLHISAHGRRFMDWRVDPEGQHAIIAGGKALNIYDVNRAYIENPWPEEQALPGTLPTELFFQATGIFPLTKRPAPRDPFDGESPAMFVDVCASQLYDRVRPAQERVGERWCHVLEHPGCEALWIDVERGCALLARESYHRETGALAWRIECSGHREVVPGVWIPESIRNLHFDYLARTPEARKRRLMDTRVAVVRAEVNSVSDDEFRFVPPPGALRLNGPNDRPIQAVAGGEELLDELVGWSRSVLKERWEQASADSGDERRLWKMMAWTLLGAAAAGMGAWTVVLTRGRRMVQHPDDRPLARERRPG